MKTKLILIALAASLLTAAAQQQPKRKPVKLQETVTTVITQTVQAVQSTVPTDAAQVSEIQSNYFALLTPDKITRASFAGDMNSNVVVRVEFRFTVKPAAVAFMTNYVDATGETELHGFDMNVQPGNKSFIKPVRDREWPELR